MKNSFEILSPFFMKLAGFCISVFLCITCLQLFVLNPELAYWQTNAFLVWLIIIAAFILCVLFFMFLFMKINNNKIYLFSLYILCCVKFVFFLLKFNIRLRTSSDAGMMLKTILCFGFLFIFLEFLHAQTSKDFIREKTVLAVIMGITSCIISIVVLMKANGNSSYNFLIFYLFYALYIFVFSLFGKETKSSIVFQCSFIALSFILTPMMISYGMPINETLVYIAPIEIFAVFCCTQLIHFKNKPISNDIKISTIQKMASRILSKFHYENNNNSYSNDLQPEAFPMIKGVFMLTLRFAYFALLAKSLTTIIWR